MISDFSDQISLRIVTFLLKRFLFGLRVLVLMGMVVLGKYSKEKKKSLAAQFSKSNQTEVSGAGSSAAVMASYSAFPTGVNYVKNHP